MSDDFQTEYDDYLENTPLEARFDPATLEVLVVEAIPKHKAYEMMFDEYLKARTQFIEYDESEKKRLSFYLPLFPAMRSSDFAHWYKISYHNFLIRVIELGMITFMYDYNEDVSVIKDMRHNLSSKIRNDYTKLVYLQMDKQKIKLGSIQGIRGSDSKHFTPHVQEWLYNAANDTATYMNMTTSDFIFLCWCIGVMKTLPNSIMDPMLDHDISNIIMHFNFETKLYSERIKGLHTTLSDVK